MCCILRDVFTKVIGGEESKDMCSCPGAEQTKLLEAVKPVIDSDAWHFLIPFHRPPMRAQ